MVGKFVTKEDELRKELDDLELDISWSHENLNHFKAQIKAWKTILKQKEKKVIQLKIKLHEECKEKK